MEVDYKIISGAWDKQKPLGRRGGKTFWCAIKIAIEKQIPKKPQFVDTRFRNHGRHVSDGCSLDKCYKCPCCNTHIFHVWDSENYCANCGQALDWSEK